MGSNLKKFLKNIFIVDWSKGADKPSYSFAMSNVKITAKSVSYFIRKLLDNNILDNVTTVHLTGHSLGAQICGLVGKDYQNPKIPTITALDPAGPGFYRKNYKKRLDKNDALSVTVVHTDAGENILQGFGILDKLGHFDFYTNSGANQPGCFNSTTYKRTINSMKHMKISCSHHRAVDLMSDFDYHNNETSPIGYACSNYATFLEGRCADCGTSDAKKCRLMSLWYDVYTTEITGYAATTFYIANNCVKPFYRKNSFDWV